MGGNGRFARRSENAQGLVASIRINFDQTDSYHLRNVCPNFVRCERLPQPASYLLYEIADVRVLKKRVKFVIRYDIVGGHRP